MARQPYVKNNNSWSAAKSLWVDNGGTWAQAKGMWENQNGSWVRVWPPDPVNIQALVVAGGGGGGQGSGFEGGGGGGAGGVLYYPSVSVSAINSTYSLFVGAGGSPNINGGDSWFGLGDPPMVQSSTDVPVYNVSYPVYCDFLNTYGVWTDPDATSPVGSWVEVNYTVIIPATQSYLLRVSADNHIKVIINGKTIGSNDDWGSYNDSTLSLSKGTTTITCQALNNDDGSPASFAAALYGQNGAMVWNTRNTTYTTNPDWPVAHGGGHGGYAPTSNGPGASGGSGGGGSGYVQTAAGGSSVVGQGNNGGTGIWQGYGQAGGGGGGGYRTTGNQSNGNNGGDGGQGYSFTIAGFQYAVAGGGGGGYGAQGYGGSGPGGAGGFGGGGAGNGVSGVDGTGGGGGGCLHGGNPGGLGGCGGVYIGYVSPTGAPLFLNGDISISDNGDGTSNILHSFTTPGQFTLVGVTG
jgi:hypothetical protein